MTSAGVLQADGSRCYTGPSCRKHGTAEKKVELSRKIEQLLTPSLKVEDPLGSIGPWQVEAFTNGDCWMLAKELHDLTDYPIILAGSSDGEFWVHMAVLAPDGRVWDVNGFYTDADEFLEVWGPQVEEDLSNGEEVISWTLSSMSEWEHHTEQQVREFEEEDPAPVASALVKAMTLPAHKSFRAV